MNRPVAGLARDEPCDVVSLIDRLRAAHGEPDRFSAAPAIDELVQTILSQHTSDTNTARAFVSLRAAFPTWQQVIDAPQEAVATSIRSGGLANTKAPRIQRVLRDARDRAGGFDLAFLRDMPLEEAKLWLTSLDGVGPKTAACVLLFSLQQPALPVDTHVHRVALRLGLIPDRTNAERAHSLLEAMLPDELVYDAHMLFIRHGRDTCVARRPRCATCVLVQCCPTGRLSALERMDTNDD